MQHLAQTTQAPSGWLMIAWFFVMGLLSLYGAHRYWQALARRRTRDQSIKPSAQFEQLPAVTVQIPLYNELAVAERAIRAAAAIDYPLDLLQIQVLDDSTDQTCVIAERICEQLRRDGCDIEYLHRATREGYKAGALANGLKSAGGDFIAVFDADFIPPADFLHNTIHHFTDERIGMVQCAWSHLNATDSLLTRAQALYLDGHFQIEHVARHRTGRWFNFNGTAGVWRKCAIEQAGGWQGDTLAEDVDLSYRAQMLGWRFVYRPDLRCPAELPAALAHFKSQQHRWAKGTIQNAVKHLPAIIGASVPWRVKLEAFFHLTSPVVNLLIVMVVALLIPVLRQDFQPGSSQAQAAGAAGLGFFILATFSTGVFYYAAAQAGRATGGDHRRVVLMIPVLLGLGIGLTISNALGVLEALFGRKSAFVRTYKSGRGDRADHEQPGRPAASAEFSPRLLLVFVLECVALGLSIYAAGLAALDFGLVFSLPFLLLFVFGYGWMVLAGLRDFKRRLFSGKNPRNRTSAVIAPCHERSGQ